MQETKGNQTFSIRLLLINNIHLLTQKSCVILLLAVTCLVSGCSTAIYVAGSVASVGHPTYSQTGVADITLRVNGSEVHARAPVGCRSFFHPTAGMRVTRDSGERFILSTRADQLELLEFSYSCSEFDAKIAISPTVLVYLYRAQRLPNPLITRESAVPIGHPAAKDAQVVLVEAKLDLSDRTANVEAVESIKGEMKKFFGESGDLRFASVEASFLSVPGPFVAPDDAVELVKVTEAALIPRELQKRVAKLLPPYSSIVETDNAQFDRNLDRIEFKYLPAEGVFVSLGRSGGRQTYYPISSGRCEKQYQSCLQNTTKARIGDHDFGFDLRMVYDPKSSGIYHFGIRWF